MKSRLFMSLLMALFMMGNVFAGTPLEDELVLKGEFSQIGGRSAQPELPLTASFEGTVLYVVFTSPVGDVNVTINENAQNVYASSISVTSSGQRIAISVEEYQAGTYTIEFRNSKGGYVYGEFTLM